MVEKGFIRRGYADVSQGQIHYATAGEGKAVLLLHQTPRSWDEYRDVLPIIGQKYRAIAMDTVGFGDSYRLENTGSIEIYGRGVVQLLDALSIDRASLVGHHTGGVIAAEVAAVHPDRVDKLVLSSTPYIDAEERERRKIAVGLHDHVGQALALAKIRLGWLRQTVKNDLSAGPIEQVRELINQLIEYTRSLTFDIGSPILYELGLEAALESLAKKHEQEYGVKAAFRDDKQGKPLEEDIKIALYQGARELLFNTAKHAQAGKVAVSVCRSGHFCEVCVKDDGVGFDLDAAEEGTAGIHGLGLFNIRERLQHLGGQLDIQSQPGRGAKVTLRAPLRRHS